MGIISLYRLLHPVAPITQKLQGRTVDVIAAFNGVKDCIEDMKTLRENVEGEFSIICQQAERMTAKFGVAPSIPRTSARQLNRNNVPALTPEEYFRRVLAVPLLDTFISEMEFLFTKFSTKGFEGSLSRSDSFVQRHIHRSVGRSGKHVQGMASKP